MAGIKQSEKQIQSVICEYLRWKGYLIWRINNTGIWNAKTQGSYFHGDKGVPDLMAINSKTGTLLYVECKSPSGKITIEQQMFFKALQKVKKVQGCVARGIKDLPE